MRVGSLYIHPRTVKGFSYAAGSILVLAAGVAFCLLMSFWILPAAKEAPFLLK